MIETLYAWIGKDKITQHWELMGFSPGFGQQLPMVTSNLLLAEQLGEVADASINHTEAQLIRFEKVEVLRTRRPL